jgi:glycosyltransferase EpsE
MSTYNDRKNLNQSIESILDQTYRNFEFLILDDASTDSSYEQLEAYQKLDKRIMIFSNKVNKGLTKSLNILIKKSKGNYIARQDSDDISMKDRFNTQINYLTDGKYDLCFTRAKLKDSGKFIPGLSYYIPPKVSIKYKNPFIHGSLMIKKSVLEKLNYYDENFYYAQDYKLFKDAMMNNYQIKYLNKAMYLLNTKDNISTLNKNEQKYYADCIKKGVNP